MGRTVSAVVTCGDAYLGTIGPLGHLPGQDCWDASPQIITSAVQRLAAAQAVLASQPASLPPGLPDRRTPVIAGQIRALLDSQAGSELSAGEVTAARGLLSRFRLLDGCGLPDTIVHGDFHPGNWRSDGGPPAIVDWADAHLGNPVLDGLRACDFLSARRRAAAARAWIDAWASRIPGCEPARALRTAAPLAHLSRNGSVRRKLAFRRVRLERMAISRQEIIDMLNHLGYSEAAKEASRVLPEQVDLKQVEEFSDRNGISHTELVSQMGGSP
jgi:Ser/Thr protein kinase RdoA (MazF antagonist)